MSIRAVILDRDGVINRDSKDYIKTPDEWHALPGSLEAIAQLTEAGWPVFIATNQSGLARGLYDEVGLASIHAKMLSAIDAAGGAIADIAYCPHGPDDGCCCRKPEPGLLTQLAEQFAIDLANSFFIGDSYRDIQAAWAVDCKPVLVKTGNGEKTLASHPELNQQIAVYDDLLQAVSNILS